MTVVVSPCLLFGRLGGLSFFGRDRPLVFVVKVMTPTPLAKLSNQLQAAKLAEEMPSTMRDADGVTLSIATPRSEEIRCTPWTSR